MGMKKSLALMSMMALMAQEGMNITKRGSVGSGRKPKLPEPKKHTPFNKEEGVLKMIEDYNLIKQGKSKKGITKQARIKKRVDEWLESGMLNENELKNEP